MKQRIFLVSGNDLYFVQLIKLLKTAYVTNSEKLCKLNISENYNLTT